jgi:hypothetical protein
VSSTSMPEDCQAISGGGTIEIELALETAPLIPH